MVFCSCPSLTMLLRSFHHKISNRRVTRTQIHRFNLVHLCWHDNSIKNTVYIDMQANQLSLITDSVINVSGTHGISWSATIAVPP